MTPVMSTESGRAAPIVGANMAGDRDNVAVLDEDGVVAFTGCALDAVAFMATRRWVEGIHCEIVEDRAYCVGLEPF